MIYKVFNLSKVTDNILVGISGGKDSAVCLDICSKLFKKVQPFFFYLVPELSFQEAYLKSVERRYNVKVLRVPGPQLCDILFGESFRPYYNESFRKPKQRQIEEYLRDTTKIAWIAYGHRAKESLKRVQYLHGIKGIEWEHRRWFPLTYWSKEMVINYIKANRVLVSSESQFLSRSFNSFDPDVLIKIKEKYPHDFEKIKFYFPYVEAAIKRKEWFDESKNREIRDNTDTQKPDQECSI